MRRGAARAMTCALAAAAVLAGCGGDPKNPAAKFHLEGSLTQVMDLGYDEARIILAPEDVSLQFVRIHPLGSTSADGGQTQGTSEDYPLKIAYRLLGGPVPAGGRVDLAEPDSNGAQRGVASRNVSNDPRLTLPPLVRGTLSFDRPLDPDTVVHGDFRLTFENGVEAASGRTAFSTYSARVQP